MKNIKYGISWVCLGNEHEVSTLIGSLSFVMKLGLPILFHRKLHCTPYEIKISVGEINKKSSIKKEKCEVVRALVLK